MQTVRQLIQSELLASPEINYLLGENLININALARNLRPVIESKLGERVGTETISMAIRRIRREKTLIAKKSFHLPRAKNIQVQLDVIILTYGKKTPLQDISNPKKYRFFSYANGRDEAMLAISQEDAALFKPNATKEQVRMTAITVSLEDENPDTVGAYAYIQTALSMAGVPVAEVLSVHDDLTLIIKDEHTDRTFQTLRNTLKNDRRTKG